MKALSKRAIDGLDLSELNLDKDKNKEFALLLNYGRNTNSELFHTSLKPDWSEIETLEALQGYFLGIYQVPNFELRFEKRGSNGEVFANIARCPRKTAYGTVFAVPKTILFNPGSTLNRSEGCQDIHNENSRHYWLRQIPLIEPFLNQQIMKENDFPMIGDSKRITCAWIYQACGPAIISGGQPTREYVQNIHNGLHVNGVPMVPQSYLDYIKSFLPKRD